MKQRKKTILKRGSAYACALCAVLLLSACGGQTGDASAQMTEANTEAMTETAAQEQSEVSASEETATEAETVEETTAKEENKKELAGKYYAKITMSEDMSVVLYLKIDEDGAFVFSRDTEFADKEKGAGVLGKDLEGNDAFLYTELNGEELESGEKTASYKVTKKGAICFTSPMWFGSTEPKIVKEDDEISYPVFRVLDAKAEKKLKKAAQKAEQKQEETQSTPETEAASEPESQMLPAAEDEQYEEEEYVEEQPVEEVVPADAAIEGTYYGSMDKYVDAMDSDVHYDVTLTLSGGNYDYSVSISVSGQMEHTSNESFSGTYSLDGDSIIFSGDLLDGSVYGDSITASGYLSSFASNAETITVFR